ncbi:MAG: large conductance mechanosensitive channel protein MscL [Leuconostoc lactis]|uniref:Large-conductance mechanosensitive channel n=1 Tax=Leuconostoc lactis TaxID=1246 RepID=A0A6L7AG04_LEULA|nr:large conductance mechanosensitive channel protein MscL [Leuconostoc lactis]ANY12171.1 mechanosensitive ion channel protein MscL [Leuconostoc lactis]MBU7536934.1 large conductance mechanosensitive channel protein MscL [Leuconostoc lactis]MCC2745073.1 large conductance mechanosensitive channel protein MscL [Leuconostoc lactis]MCC2755610.1 large conductance mechanosensitive channel protein MscL [Leuconostoc lactis]MCT8388286.1 large conductance mechanosensitive channel protein MscL [Leuconost
MWKEFKEFAFKGNVVDLAVAVVIGGAFGLIVKSLVNDIIMPLVGILIGGIDVSNLAIKVGTATVAYGLFLQSIINFLIIAAAIFMMVKVFNTMNKKSAKEAEVLEVEDTKTEKYLQEIVKLLSEKK